MLPFIIILRYLDTCFWIVYTRICTIQDSCKGQITFHRVSRTAGRLGESGETPFVHPNPEMVGKRKDFIIPIGIMLKIHQNGWDKKKYRRVSYGRCVVKADWLIPGHFCCDDQ